MVCGLSIPTTVPLRYIMPVENVSSRRLWRVRVHSAQEQSLEKAMLHGFWWSWVAHNLMSNNAHTGSSRIDANVYLGSQRPSRLAIEGLCQVDHELRALAFATVTANVIRWTCTRGVTMLRTLQS